MKENIILDNSQDSLRILVFLPEKEAFVFHMQLHMKVEISPVLRTGPSSGKIEVDLVKCVASRWQGLGQPLELHLWFGLLKVNIMQQLCEIIYSTFFQGLDPDLPVLDCLQHDRCYP